jgi:hypothetical protein
MLRSIERRPPRAFMRQLRSGIIFCSAGRGAAVTTMTEMFGAPGATKCVGRGARAHGVVGALSDDLEPLKG